MSKQEDDITSQISQTESEEKFLWTEPEEKIQVQTLYYIGPFQVQKETHELWCKENPTVSKNHDIEVWLKKHNASYTLA